jgi:hypothetical protein
MRFWRFWANVESDPAIDLAHKMRWLMSLDVEEFALARRIEAENSRLNRECPELLAEAWPHLESHERRAWVEWQHYRETYERRD